MNTLIVYATKYGSTEKCANILAKKIIGTVDLCNLKTERPTDLAKYDKVIIGSSIYIGKIQNVAKEFCLHHFDQLKDKKLGFYVCCMFTGYKAQEQLDAAFPQELLANADARECFGGELRINSMKFTEKLIVKLVAKMDKSLPSAKRNQDISTISEDSINRFVKLMNDPL